MFRENEIGCKDSIKKLNFQKFFNFFGIFISFSKTSSTKSNPILLKALF